ncbi:MAG: hypothetical protein ACRD1U_02910, partial [Vicinamibacterales bacterium]
GTAIVRGRVVGADTGAPVDDAEVMLLQAKGNSLVARFMPDAFQPASSPVPVDQEGRFEIRDAQPGYYHLGVSPGPGAARYLRMRFPADAHGDAEALHVAADQVIDNLVVALERAGVVVGRVANERGGPMASVMIGVVERLSGGRLRPVLGATGSVARSDDTGAFRLFGLPPGEYLVTARPMPSSVFVFSQGQPRTPLARQVTYYPGTPSITEAVPIRVQAGDEVGPLEFTVGHARLRTIRGIVVDSTGEAAGGVNVMLQPDYQADTGATVTSVTRTSRSDGGFDIENVTDGQHAIAVHRYGSGGRGAEFAWMPIVVSDDLENLVVRLQPAVSVPGRVTYEGKPPAPAHEVTIRSTAGGASIINSVSTQAGRDGTFVLRDLFGPTLIRVDAGRGWHLKAVLYGGRDVTDQPTEFQPNGGAVEIVLTQRAAVVSGVATTAGGAPAAAGVILLSEDPAFWHPRYLSTTVVYAEGNGQFRAAGLRPGRYLAIAVPRADAFLADATPAYFELLARAATPVVIADGENKTVNLSVARVQ